MHLALLAGVHGWSARGPPAAARTHARCGTLAMTRTEELFKTLPDVTETGGAGGQSTFGALMGFNSAWERLKAGEVDPPRQIVTVDSAARLGLDVEYDVVVVGGNIGILLATALVARGLRVAVVEAGKLSGRSQDWNASRKEVLELVRAGVLTEAEVEEVIGIEFNPVRCGFAGGEDVWLTDVLNVGVRPDVLIARARARFEALGGQVLEGSPLASLDVKDRGALLTTVEGTMLTARLVLDCMGQRSPIVAQAREGALPDGACVVVGTCADGFDADMNNYGDVIFADTQMEETAGCPTQCASEHRHSTAPAACASI